MLRRLLSFGMLVGTALVTLGVPASAPARKGTVPGCARSGKHKWGYDESSRYPFRIWYPSDISGAAGNARYLKDQMNEKIWPMETKLMGDKPLHEPQEICLVDDVGVQGAIGNTHSDPGCNEVGGTGADIFVDDKLDDKDARDVLAHEFMHALQYGLKVKCPGTWWWRESTGLWAEDFVYPTDDREHDFAKFYLEDIDSPLPDTCASECDKNREYGSYLFPFFIARTYGSEKIGEIWRDAQHQSVVDAMNSDLPGGLKEVWKRFVLEAWNAKPVDYWHEEDRLDQGMEKQTEDDVLDLTNGSDYGLDVQNLKHLSAKYFTFKVKSGVRNVSVQFPYPYYGGIGGGKPDPHAAVQALVGLDSGASEEVKDWTGKLGESYCFALPQQHVSSLTLIFSNSGTTDDDDFKPTALPAPAYVEASNVGCAQWSGTISAELDNPFGLTGVKITSTAQVTYKRLKNTPEDPIFYQPVSGGANWAVSGANGDCTYSGSGSWDAAPDDGYLTIDWNLHPVPGFFSHQFYGGTLGGPLFYVFNGSCSDGSTPVADGSLAAWNSGVNSTSVSGSGLTMTGSYSLSGDQGDVETWHWTLTSSG